ncbi:MAG: hypothetical protein RMJ66_03015 [Bacteroidia bacterium]|nr:hypothetical protein [Bacteroidia bacterium]MDW8134017.1 hypothetical protein [Bacteroidia bacterium]
MFYKLIVGISFFWAQSVFVGRAIGTTGELIGKDSVFSSVGEIVIQFKLPRGWEKDTFIALIHNPLGIVARKKLVSSASHPLYAYGRVSLQRAGLYLLTIHHPRTGARVWGKQRFYLLSPPYNTLPLVRAYHNALLKHAPTPFSSDPSLEEEIEALHTPLPQAEPISVSLSEEDLTLPEELSEPLFLQEKSEEENDIDSLGLDD